MQYPALEHLLGSYFHQDWDLDGTEDQVVDTFLTDEPDLASALPNEIDALLAARSTEEELEPLLWSMGSYYKGNPDSGGLRGFLARVATRALERS